MTDVSPEGTPTAHPGGTRALLRRWDRLRSWVEASRKELDIHARVGAAMERWRRGGETADLLLPEGRAAGRGIGITSRLARRASRSASENFIVRSAERAAAQSAAEARGGRVTCRGSTVIAVGLSAIATESGLGGRSKLRTLRQKLRLRRRPRGPAVGDNEALAKKNEREAREQAAIATSRQLTALSASVRDKKWDLSLILAVEALRVYTLEARNCLFTAFRERSRLTSFLRVDGGDVSSVAFSPDGKTIAAGYTGRAAAGRRGAVGRGRAPTAGRAPLS